MARAGKPFDLAQDRPPVPPTKRIQPQINTDAHRYIRLQVAGYRLQYVIP